MATCKRELHRITNSGSADHGLSVCTGPLSSRDGPRLGLGARPCCLNIPPNRFYPVAGMSEDVANLGNVGSRGAQRPQPLTRGNLAALRLHNFPWLASVLWLFFVPVFASELQNWDPPAIKVFPDHRAAAEGKESLSEFVEAGRQLFLTKFNRADGAGRPMATGDSKPTIRVKRDLPFQRLAGPDANSCAGCHNDPFVGGSGDFAANVFVGAHFTDPPTNSIDASVTNERNTISLFGSGGIEMLAREMTEELQTQRLDAQLRAMVTQSAIAVVLKAKGVSFGFLVANADGTFDTRGIEGVDINLVVKPFGVKGVAASLREFTNFALNQHHGIQSDERFGWARTGVHDFDGDGIDNEFSIGQVSALVAFQAALPAPRRMEYGNANDDAMAAFGEQKFRTIGCGICHVPALPLRSLWFFEPSPYNRPGTAVPNDVGGQIAIPIRAENKTGIYRGEDGNIYVAAFTDLKRHVICDADDMHFCNEERPQDFVPTNQFLSAKLWDAGTSAPYGHRGDLTTLSEAILHHSGEAKSVINEFLSLSNEEKTAIILFLRSLKVIDEKADTTGWR